ncbi:MAG: DMT family transporter [Bacteroidota bacterium]
MRKSIPGLIIGFVLLWNSGFIGAEYGLPYASPFTFLFWRYLALTIIIFLYLLLTRHFRRIGLSTIGLHMIIGILSHGVWLGCVLIALDHNVPAGIVALVVALQPLATGAFSGIVVGEKPSLTKWLGLIVGFSGVAITVLSRINFDDAKSIFGYLIPLGSVIAITTASLIQRKMQVTDTSHRLPVDLSLFYQSLGTVLIFALPAMFVENLQTDWNPAFIYSMIWLILGVSLGAYALMWLLIERIDATRVASLFYLGPPVTMLMAWIAFGDTLQITDIIGLFVVFAGVLLTQTKLKTANISNR